MKKFENKKHNYFNSNKTGLQTVERPVELILGFYKDCFLGKKSLTKNLQLLLRSRGGMTQNFITDFENSVLRPVKLVHYCGG